MTYTLFGRAVNMGMPPLGVLCGGTLSSHELLADGHNYRLSEISGPTFNKILLMYVFVIC